MEAQRVRGGGYDLSLAQLDPAVGLEDHRAALAVVQAWFEQAGLTDDEARLLVGRFNAAVDPYAREAPAADRPAADGEAYLRTRWGADFEANMAAVDGAIERLGGAELEHFLKASGLRFDPFVLRTLADAAKRWSRDDGNGTKAPARPEAPAGA